MPAERTFLYIPWIEQHGDALVATLRDATPTIEWVPLRLFESHGGDDARRLVIRFARDYPDRFARLVEQRLGEVRRQVHGAVLTLDWSPPMRIAAQVLQSQGIRVTLIPHEGIYIHEDLYYLDRVGGANCPVADEALVWGELQKRIFVSRGYPAERVRIVGAPKFQGHRDARPKTRREDFFGYFGLDPEKPLVVFAGQQLDNTRDPATSRHIQKTWIETVHHVCRANGWNFLLRLPPATIERHLLDLLREQLGDPLPFPTSSGAIAQPFEQAGEILQHCNLLVSPTSTMLLEAALLDKPSLAVKVCEDPGILCTGAEVPCLHRPEEAHAVLPGLVASVGRSVPERGWAWAERNLSAGDFHRFDAVGAIASHLADAPIQPIDLAARDRSAASSAKVDDFRIYNKVHRIPFLNRSTKRFITSLLLRKG
jgi:hypothetical protein